MRGFTLADFAPQIDVVTLKLPNGKTWQLPIIPLTFDEELEIELSILTPKPPKTKVNDAGELVENPDDQAYQRKLAKASQQERGRKVIAMIRKANEWLVEHPEWLDEHPDAMPLLEEGSPDEVWDRLVSGTDSSLVKALRSMPMIVGGPARMEVQRLAGSFREELASAGRDAKKKRPRSDDESVVEPAEG